VGIEAKLEVLIVFNLSVEMFSMFRQDSVAARLRCYFSQLGLKYELVAKHSPTCSASRLDLWCSSAGGKQAGVSHRRLGCSFLGCFHYRSCPSLCTGSCL
jgi:hypothetical protein